MVSCGTRLAVLVLWTATIVLGSTTLKTEKVDQAERHAAVAVRNGVAVFRHQLAGKKAGQNHAHHNKHKVEQVLGAEWNREWGYAPETRIGEHYKDGYDPRDTVIHDKYYDPREGIQFDDGYDPRGIQEMHTDTRTGEHFVLNWDPREPKNQNAYDPRSDDHRAYIPWTKDDRWDPRAPQNQNTYDPRSEDHIALPHHNNFTMENYGLPGQRDLATVVDHEMPVAGYNQTNDPFTLSRSKDEAKFLASNVAPEVLQKQRDFLEGIEKNFDDILRKAHF